MPKFLMLTNPVLRAILGSHDLSAGGSKAEMVQRLTEHLGTDEIDAQILSATLNQQNTSIQDQITQLKDMVENMATAISNLQLNQATISHGHAANVTTNEASGVIEDTQPPLSERNGTPQVVNGTPPTVPNVSTPEHMGMDMSGLSTARPNMRDVITVLPEFDPSKDHPTSVQFISKIEKLADSYGWHHSVVLCAVHSKLKGHAKIWMDAQLAFESWTQFVSTFLNDFPCIISSADIHIEMMNSRQQRNESAAEFYFKMIALGRQGALDDQSIIKHITNGLFDETTRKTLKAIQYTKCPDFFKALTTMSTTSRVQRTEYSYAASKPKEIQADTKPKGQGNMGNAPKCYNCNERGHISIKCPQPQKKLRCTICNKTNHEAKNCYSRSKNTISTVQPSNHINKVVPPIFKSICINNKEFNGFVDTGSSHSLIDKSMVPRGTKCHTTDIRLKGFGGALVEAQEAFTANVIVDNQEFPATFYVIPNGMSPHPVLLGRNILCRDNQDLVICIDNIKFKLSGNEGNGAIRSIQQPELKQFDINNELTTEQRKCLNELLFKYDTIFAEDISHIGRSKSSEMRIEVTTDDPIVGKRYQIPFAQRGILTTILNKLLEQNIIRPSSSPHAASVVLVKKANGENRMCVDYRTLNSVTVKRHYPMPIVEEQLAKLAGNKFFTTLDMTAGYYQIPMEEGSKQFTAFVTHEGLFEHNVMPFGLVNAPMQFQEMVIRSVVSKIKSRKNVTSYVDEVIICTPNAEHAIEVLEEVLEAIYEEGLTRRPSKCSFLKTRVKFLGHIVSEHGIQPGEDKSKCIKEFPVPKNVHEVRQFLGVTGFFRKFVERYGHKTEPLTQLLKKNQPFTWAIPQVQAFEGLKAELINAPILVLYDPVKQHEVHTDACSIGLSGILMQDEEGDMKPVSYYSRQCTEAEQKYASHELEVLAIVESLERFRLYLLGSEFTVVTDCNAVVTTKAITPLPGRIARWWLKLQEYNFKCVHRPGRLMAHVDGMSRVPTLPAKETETVAELVLAIGPGDPMDFILAMQLQDDKIKEIIETLEGEHGGATQQLKHDYVIHKSRLYRKINGEKLLVVPKAIRWRITRANHDEAGHFGIDKTIQRITKTFWFPRVRRYVKSYINACPECCYNKAKGGRAEGELHVSETCPIPFRTVHMDHLGPFPRSKRGNTYIIALICAFTKYCILKAVRTTKTTPALHMLKDVMSFFGQPTRLVTDRGTSYTSKEFEAYLDKFGINHIKTAVRTPRANGQVERLNRTILASLRCSTTNEKDWDAMLPTIQWSINSQKNATTKYAPNDLVFNFRLKNVTENRLLQALHEEEPLTPELCQTMKLEAANNIDKEKAKWKRRFDNSHQTPRKYQVGDLVVVDYLPAATGQSHKLDPKYKGPYIVTKVLDADRYVIEDLPDTPKTQKPYVGIRVTDHLKPWCSLGSALEDNSCQEDEEVPGEAEL